MRKVTHKKKNRIHIVIFSGIILFGISPFLISLFAGFVTSLFGETLNEGSAPDIPLIGDLLYSMGVSGWLFIITIPLSFVALFAYTLLFLILNIRK
jgi:hypothetical protein